MVKVIVAQNIAQFEAKAAALFVEAANAAILNRKQFLVALSGGQTPGPIYSLLGQSPYRQQVDWSQVFLFWTDERCVPKNHDDSNFGLVNRFLLSHVPLLENHIFRVATECGSPEQVAEEYEGRLRRYMGRSPGFDLVFLGMGEDGHTASLFPHSELEEKEKWVGSYHLRSRDSYRITLTYPIINASGRIVFLCRGKNKAPVIAQLFSPGNSKLSVSELPAKGIQPGHGDLIWLLDKESASGLPKSVQYEEVGE